ncbi:Carbon monoxide dehydrogenase molybdoprotein family protein [Candidatus Promineifilum breve]|uniref:Carbon monoxide dehydrogenase molybdoprotein family protein n=1 Tax=Candidatus Promineifilum breve TaxID=1806508 RepID=A0A160T7I5_9CHLR|nr:molybdopterin cofactor-binding domain-containing protein [Candidatus Promineifilum breve]CUS05055.2 Carbon monoxide dehydrogenase molybdoprotein family protein [Candidatus Promineifilum breve]
MTDQIFRARVTERVDARDKVTGSANYPGDLTPPNLLHGRVLFSGQPHARLLSLDTSAAEALPGVVAVMTARDVPRNEYGLGIYDQPVFVGPGSSNPHADISLWEGDHVAVVIAESEIIAAEACSLIRMEWEQRPVVTDVREAMKDELVLHPWHGSNILKHYLIRKGDMAAGWNEAEVIVEGEYHLPHQEHAYLQPEAGVGYIDKEGRVTVEIAGQWTHKDQEQVAHALGLLVDQVRIIYPAIGGAFGGREDMSLQIVLGLAAMRLQERGINRPVRIIWSREESIIGHHKRHEAWVKTKWGATRDGKLTAVEAELILDSGAYAYTSPKVLGNANLMVTGPYVIPNAHVDSYAVTTNNIPGGAFRGFGGPQGAFAAECQMNKLAEALEMDPVELRLKNVLREGDLLTTQTPIPKGVSMAEVIEAAAAESGWGMSRDLGRPVIDVFGLRSAFQTLPTDPSAIRRGRGFACAFKNVGFSFGAPEQCEATIELHGGKEIERVVLRHAGAEVGQGAHTAFKQMAAQATGVPVEMIELDLSDTASSGNSGSVSASRMTFMAGNSIRMAAEEALSKWTDEDRPSIAHVVYKPPPTQPYDPQTGYSMPNFSYGYVAEVVDLAVDVETGLIHVERVVCADDVGQVINRTNVEGQIEGGVVQAFGYALMENLVVRDGRVTNPYLSQYLIPGIKDIPERVDAVLVEIPDPNGPWGARGMAEMPFMPLAPAFVAALHDATGVWFDEIPLLPWRVVEKLGSQEHK